MKSKDRVAVADLARQIASNIANAHPEHWLRERGGDDESMRHTIAVGLWQFGWPDGEPGVLSHLRKLLSEGHITAHAVSDDSEPPNLDEVTAHPAAWYVSRADADKVLHNLEFLSKLDAQYVQMAAEKMSAGRYTLEEAANCVAEAGERPEPMQEKLLAAAERGDLSTYGPGELARYQYSERVSARLYYEEAYWNDLNKWLEDNEKRISFRFLQPNSTPEKSNRSDAIPFNVLLTAESTTRALEFDAHLDPGIKSALIHGLTDKAKQAEAAGAAAISTMGRKGGSKDKRPLTKAYALLLAGEHVSNRKAPQFAGTIANAIKAKVYSYSRSKEVNENLSENSDTLKAWIKNSTLSQKR